MNNQLVAYILISIVFVVVFGGVASILPSRRERQIGNLRVTARKNDLEVSIVQIVDVNASMSDRVSASGIMTDPKKRCVAWAKRYPDEYEALPEWIFYTTEGHETLSVASQQNKADELASNLSESYWNEVNRINALLPAHCIALECTRTEVRWLGYESITSTSDEFVQRMVQALDALVQLNVSVSHAQSALERQLDTSPRND